MMKTAFRTTDRTLRRVRLFEGSYCHLGRDGSAWIFVPNSGEENRNAGQSLFIGPPKLQSDPTESCSKGDVSDDCERLLVLSNYAANSREELEVGGNEEEIVIEGFWEREELGEYRYNDTNGELVQLPEKQDVEIQRQFFDRLTSDEQLILRFDFNPYSKHENVEKCNIYVDSSEFPPELNKFFPGE